MLIFPIFDLCSLIDGWTDRQMDGTAEKATKKMQDDQEQLQTTDCLPQSNAFFNTWNQKLERLVTALALLRIILEKI